MTVLSRPIPIGGHKRSKSDTCSLTHGLFSAAEINNQYLNPPTDLSNISLSFNDNRKGVLTRGLALARRDSGRERSRSIDVTSLNSGGSSKSKGHIRKRSASLERKMVVFFGRPPVNTGLEPLWPPEPTQMLSFAPTTSAKERRSRFTMTFRPGALTNSSFWRLPENSIEERGHRRSNSVKHQVNGMNGDNGSSNRPQLRPSIARRHSLLASPTQEPRRRVSYMPLYGKLFDDREPTENPGPDGIISKPPAVHAPRNVKINRRYESRFCDGCMTYITLEPVQYECIDRNIIDDEPKARLCANCMLISINEDLYIGEEGVGDTFSSDIIKLRNLHVAWDRLAIRDRDYLQPGPKKTDIEEIRMILAVEGAVLSTTSEAGYAQWVAEVAEQLYNNGYNMEQIDGARDAKDGDISDQYSDEKDVICLSDDKRTRDYDDGDESDYSDQSDESDYSDDSYASDDSNGSDESDELEEVDEGDEIGGEDDEDSEVGDEDEIDEDSGDSDEPSFDFDSGSLKSRSSGLTINEKRFSKTPWAGIKRLRTWSLGSLSEHSEASDSDSSYSLESL